MEPALYVGVRVLCATGLTFYCIINEPDFWSGLFVLAVLATFCVGVDSLFKHVFLSRAVYDYLEKADYFWEVQEEGVALDKHNHMVVAGNKEWVVCFNASCIEKLELVDDEGDFLIVFTIDNETLSWISVSFSERRDIRTEVYERIRVMTKLSCRLRANEPQEKTEVLQGPLNQS